MPLLYATLGLVTLLVAGSLWWRSASRHRQLPCPSFLAWLLLDNRLADIVGSTQTTLDRIGPEPGERLLDVGCGTGRLSRRAAQRVGPTGTVVAFDIQRGMLAGLEGRAARMGVTNIVTWLGDIASDQTLPSNSFDRAWLVTVLGELPDREAALGNLFRVIKPGGTLSITETMRDPHYQRRRTVLQLSSEAGFVATQYWGSPWEFTQNFMKPPAATIR
ncbi:MAG TPA: methyltransferase domain-containing protein [Aggregatilineales bacterium]|nr:methyltransferase domain-containing protein [Aggregatilineales bacterium]